MTGRERVMAAFEHGVLDRVPLDIGATAASAIESDAAARLRAHLGLDPNGEDAELLDALAPDLGRVRLGGGGGGALWTGRSLPPETTVADLEGLVWPNVDDPIWYSDLAADAERHSRRGRAVVLDSEIGLVDGCVRLRGTTRWLEDLLAAQALSESLMERVTSTCVGILRRALETLGDAVDAVVIYEDLAGQTRTLVSPDMYRRRLRRFHAALVETIHSTSSAKAVLHCDGAVADLLPDLIEIGIDALNPVQASAKGMNPRRLKREFGNNLCFWGGCDATAALAFGSQQQVDAEARRALTALAPDGGYVFGPTHPIDASVPPENTLALVHAARNFRL